MEMMDLLTKWKTLIDQEKLIKDTKDLVKEEIGKIMHKRKINECIEQDKNENNWSIKYQTSNRRSVDYDLLEEEVTPEVFNNIVNTTESTSLVIRKSKKKKKKGKDLIHEAPKPIKDDSISVDELFKKIPKGTIGDVNE
jgi:hypothetical protein